MFDAGGSSQPGGSEAAALKAIAEDVSPSAAAVSRLAWFDPTELDPAGQVDLLKAYERQIQWLSAQQLRVLAAMAPGEADPVAGPEFTRHEVAAALRISEQVAYQRLETARQLLARHPATLAALTDGRISYWHAKGIAEATEALPGEAAATVEARVLPRAPLQTVGELRRALRRAVICADPGSAQAAHETALAERTVDFWALPDGIAVLRMVGPATQVAAVYTALTALADRPRRDDDDRPAPARRFDGLHGIAAHLLAGDDLPTRHGQRPHINVTVAATTLLGLDDQPGELAGYGPITAETARAVAAEGTWRRILYDPADGRLLDYGRRTYTPPASLARHIIARDRTCTFPHCTQGARRCDIDHAIPWDRGGQTNPDNCGALCRRHHRAKTLGRWTLQRHPDSTCTWTSPAGNTYRTRPPPYT